jgi:hypothetical protein
MPKSKGIKSVYGMDWPEDTNPIDIEIYNIKDLNKKFTGRELGERLFPHYKRLQQLFWPEEDDHRWSDLILREILCNRITCIQGSKDCGKTHGITKFAIMDYACFPHETLILISSTDIRSLELRVWGDLKDMFVRAKEKYPSLPGKPVDHLHGIFTDNLENEDEVRNLRKGILCIPCIGSDNRWTGMEKFTGIKQKRRRVLGDEVQFMHQPYFDMLANLNKGDFKGVFVGNPIGEGDPLDKIAEPKGGWDSMPEPTKTEVWDNKFPEGRTINLVGTDSPNFDEPKNRYPYMIDDTDIAYIESVWGADSHEMYNQALGVRKPGLNARKVITREMCQNFGAHDKAIWGSSERVRVYAVDAAYGGDRCVAGWAEFGTDINKKQILRVQMPRVIPISVKSGKLAEDQIAEFVKQDCEENDIPPSHMGHDSTGRGSLGTAIARIWSADTNPIEFGGNPTERPVCSDLYLWDEELQSKRLKRCDEHYSKFVTELWFSVRYAIEGRQIRELPKEVVDDGCIREWCRVKKDKIEIESKEDTKKRMGKSPDLFDWLSIIVEMARRLGFNIARLENEKRKLAVDYVWKKRLREQAVQLRRSYALDYKA